MVDISVRQGFGHDLDSLPKIMWWSHSDTTRRDARSLEEWVTREVSSKYSYRLKAVRL